jgi:hypothetical protein
MKTAAEYLAHAFEYERLANTTPDPAFKKQYADLAECYRMLAKERDGTKEQREQQEQTTKH